MALPLLSEPRHVFSRLGEILATETGRQMRRETTVCIYLY